MHATVPWYAYSEDNEIHLKKIIFILSNSKMLNWVLMLLPAALYTLNVMLK